MGDICAAAVVQVAGDRIVVVAVDRRDPPLRYQTADLVRIRAVADEIAAAVGRIDTDLLDRIRTGLERRQIAMDVSDYRYSLQPCSR